MTTIKNALCIEWDEAPVEVRSVKHLGRVALWQEFFDTRTVLVDRAQCETNEGLLQLLPYITLFDHLGHAFCYRRGPAGTEDRLHDKLSIGLGGHVDTVVPEGLTLREHLQQEAARELQEEVGLVIEPSDLNFEAFLVDRTNAVGRVHLGIHCSYRMPADLKQPLQLEERQIEVGKFLTPEHLNRADVFARLEPWSQTVAITLY